MARKPPVYEGSAEDNRKDRAMARKRGMTPAAFEKTAADRKKDAAGQRKLNERFKRK